MTRSDQLLHDALQEHADRVAWTATPVAAVVQRAGRVRRRRRAAVVAGAVVLVAAVVVPVSLLRGPDPDLTSAVAVDPASLPPRIGYAVDGLYRFPDGHSLLTPGETTSSAAVVGGLLVTSRPVGELQPLRLRLAQPDGSVQDVLDADDTVTDTPVVGTRGSWAVVAYTANGRANLVVDRMGGPRTTRVVDAGTTVLGIDDEDATVTYLDPEGYWHLDLDGGRGATPAMPERLPLSPDTRPDDYSATSGLFSLRGFTANGANPRTPVVVDTAGQFVWGQVGDSTALFSPHGSFITQFRRDEGHALELRDARTGERKVALPGATATGSRSELRDVVWEDDTHLLATRAIEGDRRELVRVGLGGTITPLEVPTIPEDADVVWDTRP